MVCNRDDTPRHFSDSLRFVDSGQRQRNVRTESGMDPRQYFLQKPYDGVSVWAGFCMDGPDEQEALSVRKRPECRNRVNAMSDDFDRVGTVLAKDFAVITRNCNYAVRSGGQLYLVMEQCIRFFGPYRCARQFPQR